MTELILQADAEHLPLIDQSVDLCFFSPPYLKARWYGDKQKHARGCIDWVDWMLRVVRECCRATRGLVLVNCAGSTEKWKYQPAPEMLLSEWFKQGGECWRPAYYHRVGIPGSGGKDRQTGQYQWYRADIEHVLAFKAHPGPLAYANANANGHPPKWAPGGAMSHRLTSGMRVNDDPWGHRGRGSNLGGRNKDGSKKVGTNKLHSRNEWGFCGSSSRGRRPSGEHKRNEKLSTKRDPNGERQNDSYTPPVLANPGNLLHLIVGGGMMGHKLAHENEAPFPVRLPQFYINSHCPPGGIVLDPFGGSGTTAHAAIIQGCGFISSDIRSSQVNLMHRRIADVRGKLKAKQPSLFPEAA